MMTEPTPTRDPDLPRRYAEFDTLFEAVEYAARGSRGINFYSSRGELTASCTYKDLRDRAEDVGRRMVGLGFAAGDRIAMLAETSVDFVAFFIGAQYASVLPVPLPMPTAFGGREGFIQQLARQLKSCAASAVIGPTAMRELVMEAAAEANLKFAGTFEEFEERAAELGDIRKPGPQDLAYLQYSSGSTRFPHGVAVTHRSLMSNCHGIGKSGVGLVDDDRCVTWLPLYHDMGLVGTFLTALTCQVSVDFLATEDFVRRPLMWLSLMSRNRGTITYSPTFGYDICARRIGREALASLDLSSWRVAGIGGDMIRPEVMHRFSEIFGEAGFDGGALIPSYGLAECTLAVSFARLGQGISVDEVDERVLSGEVTRSALVSGKTTQVNGHDAPNTIRFRGTFTPRYRPVVNCGRPLPDYELEIRDVDGSVVPERDIGRVLVRGPSVMREYYRDPEATKEVLSADGWLDTGDIGYMKDGDLYIVGRAKDLIIVNGRNHWPQDIEWAAEQVDGVRSGDIAAISIPGEDAEEVPTVLVQCRLRDEAERADLAEVIKTQIRKATGVSCKVALIPPRTLPRTSSGKLSRAKARAQFLSGGLQAIG